MNIKKNKLRKLPFFLLVSFVVLILLGCGLNNHDPNNTSKTLGVKTRDIIDSIAISKVDLVPWEVYSFTVMNRNGNIDTIRFKAEIREVDNYKFV